MKLLLDTRTLLWWLNDDGRLEQQARDLIADPGNDILVSAVSLWEIVVKIRIGKLQTDIEEITAAVDKDGFTLLDIRAAHLIALGKLPLHPDHRDPFDHLLIAQAITEDATFITQDQNVPRYPVQFVPCSDTLEPPSPR